ncbi:quercetin dioxygenase-like cupin family protein [Breznakibacter xylanolyticus]|uniref:Quercetin dioxygenase-like cupin family protein n=1 Tax=Breznakibacter xylanolyticus TaxID=990 RepID=A0A2W7NJ70_9BACT|nr:cupin domain-containing protein [Breznakibacter xylanolyticus]MBN2742262.1 cupin domain-containing protein [Marinilabiliaceae bacterium]PZX20298.1 quercetin dioxygenase-like cupin family protein [Breznakibacter xylanolyticus]
MFSPVFQHSTAYPLKGSVSYADGAIVSKIVTKNDAGNLTLFAFDKAQGLSRHSAPFDAIVQVLEGTAKIVIDDKEHILNEGELIIMPANIPHSVDAVERFKMMLIMIKGK